MGRSGCIGFYNPPFMDLIALPAFDDNYLWLLHDGQQALVVDPGDAAPVRAALDRLGLGLASILVTHHHADHTGGVAELRDATGAHVYGPAHERIPAPFTPLVGGDVVHALGLAFRVIDVPGHTAGHIAYFAPDVGGSPLLFCGDTLFSGGCGRLFEGTPAQMLASLDALAALPADTRVCCAHEYTLSNLRFACVVEPGIAELLAYQRQCQHWRAEGRPTLPSTIGTERAINPFLRSREPAVTQAARAREPSATDEVAVFAALRQWKNEFR
jgi:hydroxyacylglutathione hydrolase